MTVEEGALRLDIPGAQEAVPSRVELGTDNHEKVAVAILGLLPRRMSVSDNLCSLRTFPALNILDKLGGPFGSDLAPDLGLGVIALPIEAADFGPAQQVNLADAALIGFGSVPEAVVGCGLDPGEAIPRSG